MELIKDEYCVNKNYPYIIKDGWGGKVYATEKDLKLLQKEIKKMLDKTK